MSSPLIPTKLLSSQATEEICWNIYTRSGVVVVPKRHRDFGQNTPLTFRDLSDLFPSREWANLKALGNLRATIFVILKSKGNCSKMILEKLMRPAKNMLEGVSEARAMRRKIKPPFRHHRALSRIFLCNLLIGHEPPKNRNMPTTKSIESKQFAHRPTRFPLGCASASQAPNLVVNCSWQKLRIISAREV